MKRVMCFLVFVFGFVPVTFTLAAEKAKVEAPVAATVENAAAKTIFDFQKELGMTDQQVAEMKKLMDNFQKVLKDKGVELNALRQELAGMIQSKKEIPVIRKQLQKIANIQVDASCFDVETSRKVDAVMTPEQLAKWKSLQEALKAQMVSEQAATAAPAGK